MNARPHTDSEALLREIARCLAVVDARAELCEPTSLSEYGPGVDAKTRRSASCAAPSSRTHRA